MLAVEIGQHLAAQIGALTIDLAGTTGNIFIESMPPSPDEAVKIGSFGGPEASTKSGYATPTIQVMVRGTTDPRTGSDRAEAIYDILHGLRATTLPGGTYVVRSTGLQSGPVSIGEDENGRHRYTINFSLEIRYPTTQSLE